MKTKFRASLGGLALGIPFLLAIPPAGCGSDVRQGAASPAAAVPVKAEKAELADMPIQIENFGTVEALAIIDIKAQVAGEVTGVFFREGQDVRKGEKLFSIDSRSREAALHFAEAARARDAAQLKNAELEVKRIKELLAKEYATQEDWDRAMASTEALQATVRADDASIVQARVQLGYCTIVSPIDGRAGKLLLDAGNVVEANADAPMVTIAQVSPIYVSFSVPEKELPAIRRYREQGELIVEASIPSENDRVARGTLTFIDNTVNTATGTILLRGTFPNEDRLLWPGQYVNARLLLGVQKQAIVVPTQAVQIGQRGKYVFVVKEDSTAEMRTVNVGRTVGARSAIASGVEPGDNVVTLGQLRIVPGCKVEIVDERPPAPLTDAGAGVARP